MRRPVWILHLFIVGLALHNLVMAELWHAGLRNAPLTVVSSWKEVLLALGLVLVWRDAGWRLPRPSRVDWLAVAYGAIVVLYVLLPQRWLGGNATHHGELLALREDLAPVGAYAFGRGLALSRADLRRLGATLLATAAGVALFGIVDIYTISLSWWRADSGVVGWFSHQLGFNYGAGLSGLPQNFVYNTGGGHIYRRLVSTFLSPLATSYLLVVALLVAAVWRLRLGASLRLWLPLTALLSLALLLTHARSSFIALALGLLAIAAVRPDWRGRLGLAVAAVVLLSVAFVWLYPHIAPAAHFTGPEITAQQHEARAPGAGPATSGFTDASWREHWEELRAGVQMVVHHPQGFGLGNSGSNASRTGVAVLAGESTYTELGVDAGLVGALVFVAWSLTLTWRVLPRNAWVGAALLAMLALGLQTDIIGVPWVVFVVWTFAGAELARSPERTLPRGPSATRPRLRLPAGAFSPALRRRSAGS